MSVAIVSSARTISLFCKMLAPPSPDRSSARKIIRAARVPKRLESPHARGPKRDGPVDCGPPDGGRRRLACGGTRVFGFRHLGLYRASRRGRRGREQGLRRCRAALDPLFLPGLARGTYAYRHRARLLLGRAAAPGRGRSCLLPKGLEALRRTPPGLDRREYRAHHRPEERIPAGASRALRLRLPRLLLFVSERPRHRRRRVVRDAHARPGLPAAGDSAMGRGGLRNTRCAPYRPFQALPRGALPDRHSGWLPRCPPLASLRRRRVRAVALRPELDGGRVEPRRRVISDPDG